MSKVRITSIDLDGLQGRCPHPRVEHQGMTGRIRRVLDHVETGITEFDMYQVELESGGVYEFAEYEVTHIADTVYEERFKDINVERIVAVIDGERTVQIEVYGKDLDGRNVWMLQHINEGIDVSFKRVEEGS